VSWLERHVWHIVGGTLCFAAGYLWYQVRSAGPRRRRGDSALHQTIATVHFPRRRSKSERLAVVEREVANLVDAVASGALRTSTAVAERLAQAEAELARLRQAARAQKITDLDRRVSRVADRYRDLVERIETVSSEEDLSLYRASLRELFGSIKVVADDWEIRFEADLRETQAALLRAAGGSANNVVAGARFVSIQ
jgi:hypothetical protein